MPKKPARNAFYFYMKEIESDLRKEGRVFPNGMADLVPVAHPRWKELPEKEKERFEFMAKEYKSKMRGVEGDQYKMDNVGNIISKRVNPAEVNEKRRQKERREVTAKWTGKDITEEKFYFIHFQTLCKTENGDYLPCEMAVIEYSLIKGITKKFHRFVEPGQMPTGYRYVCMNTSEETHQIPIENFEKADSNYTGLTIQLENFINPNGELPEYPPFYCLAENRDMNKYCLDWIHDRSRMGRVSRIRNVYCLEDLLMDLYVHGQGPKISQSGCLDILTSHHWDYTSGTRCDFHEELECKYCSLAVVQRYAYAFSDALAVVYQFRLTDKHLPSTADDDIPCVIMPPAPMSNSRQYDSSQRSQNSWSKGRGQRSEGYRSGTYRGNDDDDDEDDTASLCSTSTCTTEPLKNSLRRPNMSGIALSSNSWGNVPNKIPGGTFDNTEWPSIGGSNSGKYAGNAAPPLASNAPKPPAAWQTPETTETNIFGQSNIPLQDKTPESAGKPVNPLIQQNSLVRPLGSMGIPPPNQTFNMRGVQNPGAARLPMSLGMAGRGSNTARMPVGRGYAPSVGRGYAPPVGRGYAPPVRRGYAPPVGRGYAPPGMNKTE
ncbi:hypothetical protein SNE40_016906 [Patella caerulea]|uniref:HMG box domain-containing protein n=1 Tax=Patella caerulea TaxID=87958 RepID=A0AAN8J9F0_PATCE